MKKIILFPILFLLTINASFAQIPTNGLVAEYTFNDGTGAETGPQDDYSPGDAILKNTTPTTDRFGNANYAQDLNGLVTTYINLGTSPLLTPTQGTISMWVNIDAISSQGYGYDYNPIILAKNNNAPGSYMEGYAMSIRRSNSKHLTLTTNPPTNEKYFFSANALAMDTWYHMVMTYDNSYLCAYVRDTAGNVFWSNCILKNFTSTFHVGDSVVVGNSANNTNKRALDGLVDDIRIYNRVLTSNEILDLHAEANPKKPTPVYAELKEVLDANYYRTTTDDIYFYYTEDYRAGGLSFTVYDKFRTPITATLINVDTTVPNAKRYGTNRCKITLSPMVINEFYLLEVTNDKGEKQFLRFRKEQL